MKGFAETKNARGSTHYILIFSPPPPPIYQWGWDKKEMQLNLWNIFLVFKELYLFA